MEDNRDDLAVIVAGYTDKMNEFLSSNPGLRSRFNRFWKFDDYAPLQLIAIFEHFCQKSGFQLSDPARQKLQALFESAYAIRDETFGNARLARNLFESAISNQASRLVTSGDATHEALMAIEAADLQEDFKTT